MNAAKAAPPGWDGIIQPHSSFRGSATDALSRRDATASKNMLQLIQLRWVAVTGQIITIAFSEIVLGVALPLRPMVIVLASLVALNLLSLLRLRLRAQLKNPELFVVLTLDVAALTVQLYLSGGVTNPFILLYLLQVTLAAVLLEMRWAWAMVAITALCFVGMTAFYRPLALPTALNSDPFRLHLQGLLVCFLLDALLLVVFVTRISSNLRGRDANLARMRQQAAEEEHVVRMGLLASGAAHELGTPLATVSVILGDWQRMPALSAAPELMQDLNEMQLALERCKAIISGILLSAGEARGEAPAVTSILEFLDEFIRDWSTNHPDIGLSFTSHFGPDVAIVADRALKQVLGNLLDNAREAPSDSIALIADRHGDDLVLAVHDDGPGFSSEMLAHFGHPYHSTKGRLGGGLGLFLVVNVVRKLGGAVRAASAPGEGATVTLTLPLSSLRIGTESADAA
jgi:two-component system sensor histidine kinase RegB